MRSEAVGDHHIRGWTTVHVRVFVETQRKFKRPIGLKCAFCAGSPDVVGPVGGGSCEGSRIAKC
jgi:hypothetical protein